MGKANERLEAGLEVAARLVATAEQYERRALAYWARDPQHASALFDTAGERRAEALALIQACR